MVKGIHHICMKCGTPEAFNRVKEFYVNVLGLRIFREWPADMEEIGAFL